MKAILFKSLLLIFTAVFTGLYVRPVFAEVKSPPCAMTVKEVRALSEKQQNYGISLPLDSYIEIPTEEVEGDEIIPAYRPEHFWRTFYKKDSVIYGYKMDRSTCVGYENYFFYRVEYVGHGRGDEVLSQVLEKVKKAGYKVDDSPLEWWSYPTPYSRDASNYKSIVVNLYPNWKMNLKGDVSSFSMSWFKDKNCVEWVILRYNLWILPLNL